MTKELFIATYQPYAIEATKGTRLFPQTLLTELVLESGYSLSDLARMYNNFFGIKAIPAWKGQVVTMSTNENSASGSVRYSGTGKVYSSYANAISAGANKETLFRVYGSITEGFKGWVSFLQANDRYAAVFAATTPEEQFTALQNAGYAGADMTYAGKLLAVYNSLKNYFSVAVQQTFDDPKKKR